MYTSPLIGLFKSQNRQSFGQESVYLLVDLRSPLRMRCTKNTPTRSSAESTLSNQSYREK